MDTEKIFEKTSNIKLIILFSFYFKLTKKEEIFIKKTVDNIIEINQ